MMWSLMLACTASQESPKAETSENLVPWVYTISEPSPLLDVGGVEVAATEAIDWFFVAKPGDVFDAWVDAEASIDASCPYYDPYFYAQSGTWWWYDSCETEAGASFDGNLYGFIYAPFSEGGWQYTDYGTLNGDANVASASGEVFQFGGALYAYQQAGELVPDVAGYASWTGDVSVIGGERSASWLGAPSSFDYVLQGNRSGEALSLTITGGASGLPGTFRAIVFDAIVFDTSICPAEPSGTSRFSDDRGEWYALAWDDDCDGCAHIWYRGLDLGLACPDLGSLYRWGSP